MTISPEKKKKKKKEKRKEKKGISTCSFNQISYIPIPPINLCSLPLILFLGLKELMYNGTTSVIFLSIFEKHL
jgi:hypothetical protein